MKMHNNPVWLCFLALVFIITFVYTGKALIKVYNYIKLSSETEAGATAWSIEKEEEDRFIPLAKYTFQAKGSFYNGETLFYDEAVNNPWAAEETLKPLAAKTYHVWYNPNDPFQSTLQKKMPLKECVAAGVLWVLSIYFFWLGVYVGKVQH